MERGRERGREREKGRRESGLFILRQNGFVLTLLGEPKGGRQEKKGGQNQEKE